MDQNRHPRGTPDGGKFAAGGRPRSDVNLTESGPAEEWHSPAVDREGAALYFAAREEAYAAHLERVSRIDQGESSYEYLTEMVSWDEESAALAEQFITGRQIRTGEIAELNAGQPIFNGCDSVRLRERYGSRVRHVAGVGWFVAEPDLDDPDTQLRAIAAAHGWARQSGGSYSGDDDTVRGLYARGDDVVRVSIDSEWVSVYEPSDHPESPPVAEQHFGGSDQRCAQALAKVFAELGGQPDQLRGAERIELAALGAKSDSRDGLSEPERLRFHALRARGALTPGRTGPFTRDGVFQAGDVISHIGVAGSASEQIVTSVEADGSMTVRDTLTDQRFPVGRSGSLLGLHHNETTGEVAEMDLGNEHGYFGAGRPENRFTPDGRALRSPA